MNLSQRNPKILLFVALIFTFFTPLYIPQIKLIWFAPFLITLYYQKPLEACLWSSLGCGFLIDLTTSTEHLGLHGFNYTIVSALLYGQKRHFFGDSLSTMPIMVYLFCFMSTLVQAVLLNLFEDVNMNLGWLVVEGFVNNASWRCPIWLFAVCAAVEDFAGQAACRPGLLFPKIRKGHKGFCVLYVLSAE